MIHKTDSSSQTKKLAASLAEGLLKKTKRLRKSALIIALVGELGTGKTTFAQGFIKAVGIRGRISSPTFVLMKKFQISSTKLRINPKFQILKNIYHVDCYRIKKTKEILELGLEEILNNPQNLVLIEWAEKIKKILPPQTAWLKFRHGKKTNQRTIYFYNV